MLLLLLLLAVGMSLLLLVMMMVVVLVVVSVHRDDRVLLLLLLLHWGRLRRAEVSAGPDGSVVARHGPVRGHHLDVAPAHGPHWARVHGGHHRRPRRQELLLRLFLPAPLYLPGAPSGDHTSTNS